MARCQTGNVSPFNLHQPTPFFPKYLTSMLYLHPLSLYPLCPPLHQSYLLLSSLLQATHSTLHSVGSPITPGPRTLHPSWPGLSLGWGSGNVGVFMWGSVGVSGSPAASSIATCQPTDRYLCS
ncbi:unnamed protein product [Gadus morhua 'NCC']